MQKSGFLQPKVAIRSNLNAGTTGIPMVVPDTKPTHFQPPDSALTLSQGVDYQEVMSADSSGCGNQGCPCGSACTCGKHCTCGEVAAMEKCSTNSDLNVHLERFPIASQAKVKCDKSGAKVLDIPQEALFVEK